MEKLPGHHVPSADALVWFTGELFKFTESDLDRLVKLTRDRRKSKEFHARGLALLDEITNRSDEVTADQIKRVIEIADDIRELNRQMAAIPGAVVADEEGSANA